MHATMANPNSPDVSEKDRADFLRVFVIEQGTGKDANLIRVTATFPPKHRNPADAKALEFVYVYDSNCGWNPIVFWEGPAGMWGAPGLHFVYFYTNENGVFLPKRILRRYSRGERYIDSGRDIVLAKSTLNAPITPNRFTLARFELKDSDRVVDRLKGTVESMRDGRLWLDGEIRPPATSVFENRSLWIVALWLNFAALAIFAAYRIYSRLVQSQRSP
jgi:hypothetical protein